MRKVLLVTALLVAASAAEARGLGGGASGISPGRSFQTSGPVTGYPGASGYAPGRQMQSNGPVTGFPGASGYAPGKLKH
jgi:hypothetical protein